MQTRKQFLQALTSASVCAFFPYRSVLASTGSMQYVMEYFDEFGPDLGQLIDPKNPTMIVGAAPALVGSWFPKPPQAGPQKGHWYYYLSDETSAVDKEARQQRIAADVRYRSVAAGFARADQTYQYSEASRMRIVVEVRHKLGEFVPSGTTFRKFTTEERNTYLWVSKIAVGGIVRFEFTASLAASEDRQKTETYFYATVKYAVGGASLDGDLKKEVEKFRTSRQITIQSSVLGGDPTLIPYSGTHARPVATNRIDGTRDPGLDEPAKWKNAIDKWVSSLRYPATEGAPATTRALTLWVSQLPTSKVALREIAHEDALAHYAKRYGELDGARRLFDRTGCLVSDPNDKVEFTNRVKLIDSVKAAIVEAATRLDANPSLNRQVVEGELTDKYGASVGHVAFLAIAPPSPPSRRLQIERFSTGDNESQAPFTMRVRCLVRGPQFDELRLDLSSYADNQGVQEKLVIDGRYLVFSALEGGFERLNPVADGFGLYRVTLRRAQGIPPCGDCPPNQLGSSFWTWHEAIESRLGTFPIELWKDGRRVCEVWVD